MKKQRQVLSLAIAALASHSVWAAGTNPPPPAAPTKSSALLQLDDGRAGSGNLLATTGIRGFSKPPSVTAHALIMTIGDYQAGIPKLKGVPYDTATATEIATRMGVPAANIVALKDGELTLEGMRKALDAMEAKLSGNDQLFVYYSGHGGRQIVQEESGERCAESLITVDGQAFTDTELEQRLKKLSQKTQKTIVFLDACHSGGVTTRSIGGAAPAYMAKSYTPPGQSCTKPTNILTRNIVLSKTPGTGASNFVHIAAARDSEVSLDQPGRGGVASQAWLACLAGAAKDTDGSGGLSAQEVQACAQDRIDKQLGGAQGFLPHHVTITGNSGMVLSYAAQPSAPAATTSVATAGVLATAAALLAGNVASTNAAAPNTAAAVVAPATQAAPMQPAPTPAAPAVVAANTPVVVAPPAPVKPVPVAAPTPAAPIAPATPANTATSTSAPQVKPSAIAALNDIHNSRDDRRLLSISAEKTQLKIGRDKVDFTITTREGGYLYLLMVGSDGKTFDLLFPNQIDGNNLLEPGASMRLPRASWAMSAEGPPGKNTLLAIVSDAPRNFADAGLQASGPFSSAKSLAAKDIQLVTANSAGTTSECSSPAAMRNLAIKKRCSAGYAAALITLEEVQ